MKYLLVGRAVMVPTDLTTDPMRRQGYTGRVVEVSGKENDTIVIEFEDGRQAAYQADGLLTLYPKTVMHQGLRSNLIDKANRITILSVINLVNKGKSEDALKLAMTTDTSKFFCTTNCTEWLELKNEQKRNSKKSPRRYN